MANFFKDFTQLLKDELKQQNKSDADVQSTLSFIENDAEFKELRGLQAKEDKDFFANTKTEELSNDSEQLKELVKKDLKELEAAIENHAARVEHMEQTYFKHAEIPTVAPTPTPTEAPTTTPTPSMGTSAGGGSGGSSSSGSSSSIEPE